MRARIQGRTGAWDCSKATGDYFETRHRRKDGSDITVEITTNAAYYKGVKLIFCNCRDITERKRDQERIRYLATTDALTGIMNRGEFTRHLTKEIERAARFNRPVAVVMYDLDHFKRVNDTYGHDAGDEVLKTAVAQVNNAIRRVDVHARWGGEEFILLLPETDLAAAVKSAERLRAAIAEHPFKQPERVTASFGVTTLGPRDRFDVLIKRADDALYLAKHAGRNRVEALSPEAPSSG
ncbi:GGDEF domain-containing protein [Alkalilimnicola ehrlichii MLHE-1]|uniref:diguanylate cyclase n=1 Tax=Alkalilimnicola ehrlichii (strain ATCC BAA-1101 / DSM 17681 / MLHE-1) TaxID=187272 RepID=Q0A8G7_ALKEH|nr:sensor domain-containing diguanylate cyclase [Alkalilimnicola ehrlichii]ABI56870.1 diguanylate cyclase [Alkalilimnicola ehrlichii MLHE-1]